MNSLPDQCPRCNAPTTYRVGGTSVLYECNSVSYIGGKFSPGNGCTCKQDGQLDRIESKLDRLLAQIEPT